MKRMRKFVSVLLAMVMVLGMGVTAFATELPDAVDQDEYTITIQGKTSGHKYVAYQIFTGELATKTVSGGDAVNVLSNIKWGNGIDTENTVDGKKLIEALAEAQIGVGTDVITANMTASEVAGILAKCANDSEQAKKFADVVGKYVKGEGTGSEVVSNPGTNNVYEIKVTAPGYYLVKDNSEVGTVSDNDGNTVGGASTDYILEVVADVDVLSKDTVVTWDKDIVTGVNGDGSLNVSDANTAAIGENVSYRLTSVVPDHSAYNYYYFIMKDDLSDGLDFNNDVVVTVGEAELVRNQDYYVYTNVGGVDYIVGADGKLYTYVKDELTEVYELTEAKAKWSATGASFEIAFTDLKDYAVGAGITVTYSATVNDDAKVGVEGNPNKFRLEYSNDPNRVYPEPPEETPGIPADRTPGVLGETPDSVVVTYVAVVEIFKTQDNETTPLPGAEFTLTGTYTQVVLNGGVTFEADPNGSWYLLKNGKYTQQEPTTEEYMEKVEGSVTAGYVVAEEGYAGTDAVTVKNIVYRPYKAETDTDVDVYVLVKPNTAEYATNDEGNVLTYTKIKSTTNKTVTKDIILVGTSDENGKVVFKGLGAGVYKIEETITPAGFNTIAPFELEITCVYPSNVVTGEEKCTWGVGDATTKKEGTEEPIFTVNENVEVNGATISGVYSANIINMSGLVLPSTGGIGTTIFYVAGSILVLAAVVLLVTKKRMVREK